MIPLSHTHPFSISLLYLTSRNLKLKNWYESLNCIGPTPALIKFTRVPDVHMHITLDTLAKVIIIVHLREQLDRSLQIEGGKIWSAITTLFKTGSKKSLFGLMQLHPKVL